MEIPLQVISVHNMARAIEQPLARSLLGGVALLRSRGYGPDYPSHYLAMDAADLVCTHHLFCQPEDGKWTPVAGYRQVSLRDCEAYGLELPLLKTVRTSGSADHVAAMEELVEGARNQGKDVLYCASFTIQKQARPNRVLSQTAKELLAALHHVEEVSCVPAVRISAGVLRFKVNDFYQQVGFFPLRHKGEVLPPVSKASAAGELIQLLRQEHVSDWCRACYLKHRALVDNRITVGTDHTEHTHLNPRKEGATHGLRPGISA
jgi:hypothetical protein